MTKTVPLPPQLCKKKKISALARAGIELNESKNVCIMPHTDLFTKMTKGHKESLRLTGLVLYSNKRQL